MRIKMTVLLRSGASTRHEKAQQLMANLEQPVDWDLAMGFDTEDRSVTWVTVEVGRVADIASLVEPDSIRLSDWDRSCKVLPFVVERLVEGHCT